jgi:cytochrome c553
VAAGRAAPLAGYLQHEDHSCRAPCVRQAKPNKGGLYGDPVAAARRAQRTTLRVLARGQRGCHGARGEGNAALQSPALAARSDWYLATQLTNYRTGLRGADERDSYGAQMRAIAATLADDKAITDVVAYITTLK